MAFTVLFISGQPKGSLGRNLVPKFDRNTFCIELPFCLSAEGLSFGRKALFWQKPALSAGSLCQLGRNNLHDILQKTLDILFRQKLPLSVVSVFLPKELF